MLVPGARIANGRYRSLIFHGVNNGFWQADIKRWTARVLTFVTRRASCPDDVPRDTFCPVRQAQPTSKLEFENAAHPPVVW